MFRRKSRGILTRPARPGNDANVVPLPLVLGSITEDERRQSTRYIIRNILSNIPQVELGYNVMKGTEYFVSL